MDSMQSVFEAARGNDGLRPLADAWHRRVMADDVVAPAFSHGFHPQHVERLAAYWGEALGGPTTYSDSYGEETTVVNSPGRPRQRCPPTTTALRIDQRPQHPTLEMGRTPGVRLHGHRCPKTVRESQRER